MEQKPTKIFVNLNQTWSKAIVQEERGDKYVVESKDGQHFEVNKNSKFVEAIKSKGQQFAYADVKEKLEGAYVSFDKLPENIKKNLSEGKEYFHEYSYTSNGTLKEGAKMVQMRYDKIYGSALDVQSRRNEVVTLETAIAFNYKFTKAEFEKMLTEKKHVFFNGISNDGETFPRLAYYEQKLKDIRTRPALSQNTYFFGKKLTESQAEALNQGASVEISIENKETGKIKNYEVSFSAKPNNFITKDLEKANVKDIAVDAEEISASPVAEKKNNKGKKQEMTM